MKSAALHYLNATRDPLRLRRPQGIRGDRERSERRRRVRRRVGVGTEIECGGQRVKTGDWIVADDNGVVIIPREKAHEMANRAVEVKEQEDRLRAEIDRGSSLSKVLKLKKWEKVVG